MHRQEKQVYRQEKQMYRQEKQRYRQEKQRYRQEKQKRNGQKQTNRTREADREKRTWEIDIHTRTHTVTHGHTRSSTSCLVRILLYTQCQYYATFPCQSKVIDVINRNNNPHWTFDNTASLHFPGAPLPLFVSAFYRPPSSSTLRPHLCKHLAMMRASRQEFTAQFTP